MNGAHSFTEASDCHRDGATPIMMAACGKTACARHDENGGGCGHSKTHRLAYGCDASGGDHGCPLCATVAATTATDATDPVTLLLNEAGVLIDSAETYRAGKLHGLANEKIAEALGLIKQAQVMMQREGA